MAIGSIITIGLSAFQDLFGRRRLLLLSFILAVSGFMCVSSGTSLVVCLIGLILLWSYVEVSYIILIVLSNELIVNPVRKYVHNCFSIVLCFGGVFGNFLTHYLTSYQSLMTVIFFCYLLGFLLMTFLFPESPSFLLKQHKYEHLKQVIKGIASTNGLSQTDIDQALDDLDSVIECSLKDFSLIIRRAVPSETKSKAVERRFLLEVFFTKIGIDQTYRNHIFGNHDLFPVLYLRGSFRKAGGLYDSTEKLRVSLLEDHGPNYLVLCSAFCYQKVFEFLD